MTGAAAVPHPTLCPRSLDLGCFDKFCKWKLHTQRCQRAGTAGGGWKGVHYGKNREGVKGIDNQGQGVYERRGNQGRGGYVRRNQRVGYADHRVGEQGHNRDYPKRRGQ